MRTPRGVTLLVTALVAASVVTAASPVALAYDRALDPFYAQSAEWKDCNVLFPDPAVAGAPVELPECAAIVVPRDYRRPQAGTLSIAVHRRKAKDPAQRQGVLMLNPGGPGGDGILMPGQFGNQAIAQAFDLIGFSPRGTGFSTNLWCAVDSGTGTTPTRPTDEQFAAITAEARRLEEQCAHTGGELREHITTANTARDMDVIRAAIGEKKINYLGFSYGTYLGAVYGSLFPQHLNRSVLDSSMHPDWFYYEAFKTQAVASKQNFDAWAAWVSQRDNTYGLGRTGRDVHAAMEALGERLALKPVPGGPQHAPLVTRDVLDQMLGLDTVARPSWHVTALMIKAIRESAGTGALSADAASALGTLIAQRETVRVNGVWYAVTCEANWHTDLNVYYRQMRIFRERYPYGPGAMAAAPKHCTFSSSRPTEKLVPLKRSGYPAGLVVQAEYDPKTQYAGGPAMARRLSARLLTVTDEGGHGMYGRNSCATKRVDDYLINGVLPVAGATCPGAPRPDIAADGEPQSASPTGSLTEQVRAASAPSTRAGAESR
ncbi:alpha/beta fold hydrolase [Amycolatopsis sp. NPDC057786]|uniref:alpha/beta fold hydrolase n=1 Tax=Amycolatopsis sp. NPDC057786 TaxID=3346250 RepID=UPI00366D6032